MASEVKVLVKAENQTKTGFQAALNDAKKFGQEATKAATPGGQSSVDGGSIRKALKGIGQDLATASTPAEAFQAVATRLAGVFGKVTAAVGAFAIGEIIAGQFRKVTAAFESSQGVIKQFNADITSVNSAATFESAISGFEKLDQQAKQVRETLNGLNSDIGGKLAAQLTGASRLLEQLADTMDVRAAVALNQALLAQSANAKEMAGAISSGNQAAVADAAIKQQREAQLKALQDKADASTDPEARAYLYKAQEQARQLFRDQDAVAAASAGQAAKSAAEKTAEMGMTPQERLEKERRKMEELQRKQKDFSAAENFSGPDPEGFLNEGKIKYRDLERQIEESKQRQLALDKQIAAEEERKAQQVRSALGSAQDQAKKNQEAAMTPKERLQYEMRGLQDLAGMAGPEVEAQRQAAIGRIMALQQQMNSGGGGFQGSQGASAFQRIGFASNEFFDTRKAKDPTAETAKAVAELKKIHKALSSGEPLVLNPSSG